MPIIYDTEHDAGIGPAHTPEADADSRSRPGVPGVSYAEGAAALQPAGGSIATRAEQPMLYYGSRGPHVEGLQALLNLGDNPEPLAVDGIFGPLTLAAVRGFQQARAFLVDGIVGPQTWGGINALSFAPPGPGGGGGGGTAKTPPALSGKPYGEPVDGSIHPTMVFDPVRPAAGIAVAELQFKLGTLSQQAPGHAPLGPPLAFSGIYDLATLNHVLAFKTRYGITEEGDQPPHLYHKVGPKTWAKLDALAPASPVGHVERDSGPQFKPGEESKHHRVTQKTSRYNWVITPNRMGVWVNVNFLGETGAVGAVAATISSRWGRFDAVNMDNPSQRIPIHFAIAQNAAAPENTVVLSKANTAQAPPGNRSNAGNWVVDAPDFHNVATHEFGHLIGLRDEYGRTADDIEEMTGQKLPGEGHADPLRIARRLRTILFDPLTDFVEAGEDQRFGEILALLLSEKITPNQQSAASVTRAYSARFGEHVTDDILDVFERQQSKTMLLSWFSFKTESLMGVPPVGPQPPPEPRHVTEFVDAIQVWYGGRWTAAAR